MKLIIIFLSIAGSLLAQVSFDVEVWPILKSNCVDCHRKPYEEDGKLKKPKAGLRLDGAWHIMKGSDDGPVIVADRPDASTVYHHISLPADDDDIMPPKGDPLSSKEIKVIEKWIKEGAGFGTWEGALDGIIKEKQKEQYVPRHVLYFKGLEKGLKPLPESLFSQLSKSTTASIRRLHPKSPLIDVGFFTTPNEIGDDEVAQLVGLREHVTKLGLARTQITDQSLGLVGQFPKLSYLNLKDTSVTDTGLARLSGLKNLTSLNLYGTRITDASIKTLGKYPNLKKLYLANTGVTRSMVERLTSRLPELTVVF